MESFWVNLLLGWTVVGWVVAMVILFRRSSEPKPELASAGQGQSQDLVLGDLLTTGTSSRYKLEDFHPGKDENVLWAFRDVGYYRKVSFSEYQAGSRGVSFQIAKGVRYRVGGSKGRSVRRSGVESQGKGTLILTGVAFLTPRDLLRIPLSKILAFQGYRDGFSLPPSVRRSQLILRF
ncbi:MAG: superinfection immunity protein [Verrucomicrobia bacterium]|nr:superinfection immunity protein [Verrucomicrobiota bacterium]